MQMSGCLQKVAEGEVDCEGAEISGGDKSACGFNYSSHGFMVYTYVHTGQHEDFNACSFL